MPDHFKGLIVILVLATAVFVFARRPALTIMEAVDFTRRRNLWFALTLVAFLSSNYWLYTFVAILLLLKANRRETNPPALFYFILFALPMDNAQIPGMGLFSALFELNHTRILEIVILLPVFFSLHRQSNALSFGKALSDKLLASYLLLTVVLYLRDSTLTGGLRQAFYLFLDVFLPYAVFSRSLKNLQAFRDVLMSFVLAVMVLSLIAIFEFFKHWLLYQPLISALQLEGGDTAAISRDGMLRVIASTGYPIVLGYIMVVGMGFYLFLRGKIKQTLMRRLGTILLTGGLIVPLSRGPWLGAAVLMFVFIATGRYAARRLMILALAAMLSFPLISLLPGSERVINLLPFIGSTGKENVDYREKLITNSMIVIQRNPWFGSTDFLESPEMEAMRQGQGIIDVVNSYIAIALQTGFTGLGLFVAFFALTLIGIFRAMRSISSKDSEDYLLGRVLLATLLAIMVIIVTASSTLFIPIVYWSVAGMGVAYAQMVRKQSVKNN